MRKLVPFTLGTVCILLALLLTVLPASAARVHHRNTLADPVLLGYTSVKTLQGWRHGHQRGIRLHGHDLGHRDEHQRLPRLDRWCVARLVRGKFQPARREARRSLRREQRGRLGDGPALGRRPDCQRHALLARDRRDRRDLNGRLPRRRDVRVEPRLLGLVGHVGEPFSIGGHWSSNPRACISTARPHLVLVFQFVIHVDFDDDLHDFDGRAADGSVHVLARHPGYGVAGHIDGSSSTCNATPCTSSTSTRPTTRCWHEPGQHVHVPECRYQGCSS